MDTARERPFDEFRTTVRPEWVDYNGHMNDAAYVLVCSEANELLLEGLGLSADYRQQTECALFTVEAHLRYLHEVHRGAGLRAETIVVDADAKRLRTHTTVLDEADREVLTGEYLFLHVDHASGRVTPFPADRMERVQTALAAHRLIKRPAHLGLGVGAPRGAAT